jgi:uncharacterized protein (TIGR02466 family)
MNIVSLFPTAVGMFDLNRSFTDEELSVLLKQEEYPNMGNKTSKERFIFRNKILADLFSFATESVNKYFQEVIAPSKEVSLYITQSWMNYSKKNEWHHAHEHPNSVLSGVFYIQTDNEDKIYFERVGYEQISFPTEKYNLYNSKSWWIPAIQGRLIIFPSSLRHHVMPVTTDHTRVSLSFNTFAKGLIGAEETLTALEVGQVYT